MKRKREAWTLGTLSIVAVGLAALFARTEFELSASPGLASPSAARAVEEAHDESSGGPRQRSGGVHGSSAEQYLQSFWGDAWPEERPRYVAAGIDLDGALDPSLPGSWSEVRPAMESKARKYFERGLETQKKLVSLGLLELLDSSQPGASSVRGLLAPMGDADWDRFVREAPIQLADSFFELELATNGFVAELDNAFTSLLQDDGLRRSPLVEPSPGSSPDGQVQTRVHVEDSGWFAVAELRYADWPQLALRSKEVETRARETLVSLKALSRGFGGSHPADRK